MGWTVRGSNPGVRGWRDFLHPSSLALVPTQFPVQGVMGLLPWGKAAGE